ncbi:MAG: hypothetical protein EOO10_14960 [Chitinophagaceae bacterium]|nr:MAG: hypothetical protein EOO10_14960 [Chitinophagaceae bacterium]
MKMKLVLFLFSACFSLSSFSQDDALTKYITHIKDAYEKRTAETSMGTVGYEMVYGLESFDAKSYDYASWRFETVLRMDPSHAYAQYLLGLCQLAMGKETEGNTSVKKAVALLAALSSRLEKDVIQYTKKPAPKDVVKPVQKEDPKTVVKKDPVPAKNDVKPAAEKVGGPLVFGNYNCHYQQYQGTGAIVAYKSIPQGYFRLNADGTYRWLDNGETGKYKYDAKTGKITWLSGYFANSKPVSTVYVPGEKVASIKVEMRKNYTWGCGCNK